MKKYTISIITIFLVAFWVSSVVAGELSFPTTEDEIVKALSLKDGETVYQGVTYESKAGKVFKVIDGKRYRMRGLQGIVDSEIVPKVGALINFDFNSAEIRSDSYPLLDEFGKALKGGLSDVAIIIAGHTDHIGSNQYNQGLSEDRAKAVASYLQSHHEISSERFILKGFGETKPIISNDTDEGRFKNRRVEFIRME
jgi:outer membrane protein OmpA-like peptidoglycan-associated protein